MALFHPSASPVWPPTGLALAVMLLLGRKYWPAVLLGAFAVNVTTDPNSSGAAMIAVGNTLEAVIGALLIERFAGSLRTFETVRGVLAFTVLGALLSPVISASFGIGALMLTGGLDPAVAPYVWITWWLGDMVGAMVVTPLVVLWGTSEHTRCGFSKLWEAVGVLVAIAFVGAIVFGPVARPLGYLCLLPIVWTSIRFVPRDTALCVVLISAMSAWGTLVGWGPFASGDSNSSLLLLQAFIGVCSFIGMTLSAAILERRLAEQWLEGAVKERTEELRRAHELDRANAQRLGHVIDHLTVATIAVDERLKVLVMNDRFRDLFGLRHGRALPRSLSDVFGDIRGSFREPHETVSMLLRMLSDRARTTGLELRMHNGARIVCDYIPVFDGDALRGHVFLFKEAPPLID